MAVSKKKRLPTRDADVILMNNVRAMEEGPTKKRWSKHDLKSVRPLTNNQHDLFQQYFQGDNIVVYGSAGTGKTYLSVFLAMCDVLDGNKPQDHVIIVRSVVTTRDIGFLPGTVEEKVSLFETPYKDILADLCGRTNTYDNMKDVGLIKFIPTSYIRGLTWDNAVVIIEEGQNMTSHEIHSVMTRIGKDTRVLFTGDLGQNDLEHGKKSEKTGMKRLLKVTEQMKEFSSVCFTADDIVRSDFVKSWIIANESIPEE